MEDGLIIGVDGGGTHTVAVAARSDGRVIAATRGASLNYHNIGMPCARERLHALVTQLQSRCGGAAVRRICVGMSALDSPADEATKRKFAGDRFAPGILDMQSDAYIALMGFTLGAPGVIVVCGTGSMLLMMDAHGNQHARGGWGYLLGDPGSGYTLARMGLGAVIEQAEGLGPQTCLTDEALAYFDVTAPRGIIDRVYAEGFTPDKLAGFAKCVLRAAQSGDAPSCAILRENMRTLAQQAAMLIKAAPEASRVGLYGGVFLNSAAARAAFEDALLLRAPAACVCLPKYPPELGALIHCLRAEDSLTEDALRRMKASYEEITK